MDIPVTQQQLENWLVSRHPIQQMLPHLTAAQREFLMTGVTPEEWDLMFPKGDDE